jgi:leader peptidase (prepilin peptidase)/N-methyltransferase
VGRYNNDKEFLLLGKSGSSRLLYKGQSVIATLVCIAGLFWGALLNIVIIRLPRERRFLGWPRCTRTGEPLAWWQLLPVLGWLIQRGRAANGRSLHWIYPVVELLTAVTFLRIYQLYSISPAFWYLAFVCSVLIVTGAIDWLVRYIYTFVILAATVVVAIVGPLVGFHWLAVLLGALAGGFFFGLLFVLARVLFRGTAVPFGLGDVYLAIFIGTAVTVVHMTAALFYGMLLAGVFAGCIVLARRGNKETPTYISYGTFLCLGVVLYIALWGLPTPV